MVCSRNMWGWRIVGDLEMCVETLNGAGIIGALSSVPLSYNMTRMSVSILSKSPTDVCTEG